MPDQLSSFNATKFKRGASKIILNFSNLDSHSTSFEVIFDDNFRSCGRPGYA